MLVCVLFAQIARETAGAACTRSSLRPSSSGGTSEVANLGRSAPREGQTLPSRHCERSEAIHIPTRGAMDCFASLAMTWIGRGVLDTPWAHDTSATSARVLWRWDNVMASSALKSALRFTACMQAVNLKTNLRLSSTERHRRSAGYYDDIH